MTRDARNISLDERPSLSADLHRLLVEQIAFAREGHFARVEELSVQADAVVTRMTQYGNQTVVVEDVQGEGLERLYGELLLMLKAEQVDVQGNLKQLRQVKRAVGAYGGRTGSRSQSLRSTAQSDS